MLKEMLVEKEDIGLSGVREGQSEEGRYVWW
jgi:hypothetical protein